MTSLHCRGNFDLVCDFLAVQSISTASKASQRQLRTGTKKLSHVSTGFFAKRTQIRLWPWTNLQIVHGNFFFVPKRINYCIISFNGDYRQGEY